MCGSVTREAQRIARRASHRTRRVDDRSDFVQAEIAHRWAARNRYLNYPLPLICAILAVDVKQTTFQTEQNYYSFFG